jgi:hypothetical protein
VFNGNKSDVRYSVSVGNVSVAVDWEKLEGGKYTLEDVKQSGVLGLVSAVRDAVAVWYNVTGKLHCFDTLDARQGMVRGQPEDLHAADALRLYDANGTANVAQMMLLEVANVDGKERRGPTVNSGPTVNTRDPTASVELAVELEVGAEVTTAVITEPNHTCTATMDAVRTACWGLMCCNENLHLVNTRLKVHDHTLHAHTLPDHALPDHTLPDHTLHDYTLPDHAAEGTRTGHVLAAYCCQQRLELHSSDRGGWVRRVWAAV